MKGQKIVVPLVLTNYNGEKIYEFEPINPKSRLTFYDFEMYIISGNLIRIFDDNYLKIIVSGKLLLAIPLMLFIPDNIGLNQFHFILPAPLRVNNSDYKIIFEGKLSGEVIFILKGTDKFGTKVCRNCGQVCIGLVFKSKRDNRVLCYKCFTERKNKKLAKEVKG